MTALRYIAQVLRPTLLPLLAQHRDVITFQQDNARPHTVRITMAFLGEHGVNVLPWPAYSPDMSPIEHLWDQLGRRIRNLNPRPLTRPQLIAALHAEWANIPQDSIRRLIRSMRRRCRIFVAQHCGHTPSGHFVLSCVLRNLSKINVIKYSWCHNFEILFVGDRMKVYVCRPCTSKLASASGRRSYSFRKKGKRACVFIGCDTY